MKQGWKGAGLALLATVLIAGSAFAQGRGGFGRGFGGGGLLRMPEVQTELKLSDEQKTKVTALMDKLRQERQGQFAELRDLSQEERQKKMAEWRAGEDKQLKAILNDDQFKRYHQLQLQQQGLSALREIPVQEDLKLSQDQRTKVGEILQAQGEEQRKLFEGAGGGQGDFAALRPKMEEIRKKTDEKLEAVLTDDQKKQWKAMLGEPFKFPEAPPRGAARGAA